MQSSQLLDLVIRDEASLSHASDILHDAVFLAGSWCHDEENRCFRLRLWREVPEVFKRKKLFLCLSRLIFQRAACELTVHQVNRAVVRVRDRLDCYNLFGIRHFRERGILVFETEGAVSVEASIANLDCRLLDTGETAWNQHGYSFLSFSWRGKNKGSSEGSSGDAIHNSE
jgi:hypothetical protein